MHRPLLIAALAALLAAVPAAAKRPGPFGDYGLHVYNVLPPGESGSVPPKPSARSAPRWGQIERRGSRNARTSSRTQNAMIPPMTKVPPRRWVWGGLPRNR